MGYVRLMEVLLQQIGAPLFAKDGKGHSIACMEASCCNVGMLRVCLQAHRARGTLHKALVSPCLVACSAFIVCRPLFGACNHVR